MHLVCTLIQGKTGSICSQKGLDYQFSPYPENSRVCHLPLNLGVDCQKDLFYSTLSIHP